MTEAVATTAGELTKVRADFPTAQIIEHVHGRVRVGLEVERLYQALATVSDAGSHSLADLTAVDLAQVEPTTMGGGSRARAAPRLRVLYLLRAPPSRCVQLSADFNPAKTDLKSIIDLWPGADWLEREVAEMFGVRFSGRVTPRPLLIQQRSAHHPLLKSYPLRGEPVADVDAENSGAGSGLGPDTTSLITALPTLRMRLREVAGRVALGAPVPGFAHCGIEKLAESLTYMQAMVLCERLNEQAPQAGSLGLALAVESALEIEVPPRGNYQRVVIAELSRLRGHLAWLSMQSESAGANVIWREAMQLRATVIDVMDQLRGVGSGTGLLAIGGQSADFPPEFADCALALSRRVRTALTRLRKQLTGNRLWRDLVDGIAPLSATEAAQWGLSGPVLRACGTGWDLRKQEPYLAYGDLDFDVPVGSRGDALDRCTVRIDEMVESTGLIEQAIRQMPAGPWRSEDRRVFPTTESAQVGERVETMIRHMQLWTEGHGLRLSGHDH